MTNRAEALATETRGMDRRQLAQEVAALSLKLLRLARELAPDAGPPPPPAAPSRPSFHGA